MVTFKIDGNFYHKEWNGNIRKYEETQIDGDLIPYLNDEFEIEGDVTFNLFMSHIFQHWQTYSMVFSSHLGHYSLSEWLSEFMKPTPTPIPKDILYLEVKHGGIEISASGPNKFGSKDIEIYDDFRGIGPVEEHQDGGQSLGSIGVDFTPLNELKSYNFKLNNKITFYDYNTYEEICTMEKCFSVYDVIGAILYEISWYGSPEQRDDKGKKIIDDVKKSKEELDKGNLEKFITAEEMFARLDKKIEDFKKKDE